MGMRATINYVKMNDEVQVTTVQWSTVLDVTVGHYLHSESEQGVSLQDAVKELISSVTQNEHISALSIMDKDEELPTVYPQSEWKNHNVAILGIQNHEDNTFESELDVPNGIYDNHLNGGSIGAIYRESKPDVIEFFFGNDDTGDVEVVEENLADLAEFYSDVPNNPQKRKDYSFRD